MMVGIVDADLLDSGTRHPNLALLKIAGFLHAGQPADSGQIPQRRHGLLHYGFSKVSEYTSFSDGVVGFAANQSALATATRIPSEYCIVGKKIGASCGKIMYT